jgi:hypothetical protein
MKTMKSLLFLVSLFLSFSSFAQKTSQSSSGKGQTTVTAKSSSKTYGVSSANSQASSYTISSGQSFTFNSYDLDTTFTFTGESRTASLDFVFEKDSNELSYHASGSIKGGSLKIFLVDPKGKKHPGFTLKAKGEGTAKGVVNEVNDDIIPGKWKIEVKNINATGEINIKVGQN